jgi:hypothetical protein
MNDKKEFFNKNIQSLHLPSEISNIELLLAEQKTEEKKEIVLENQPSSSTTTTKKSNTINKLLRGIWYTRPISDEGDLPDETEDEKTIDDHDVKKRIVAPDIDTSHSINNDDSEIIEQNSSAPIPSWINDQVYGDKVSVEL